MSIHFSLKPVAVTFSSSERCSRAKVLADRLGLPLIESGELFPEDMLVLMVGADALRVEAPGEKELGTVSLDFVSGRNAHRRRFGGGRGQPLARAVGLKKGRTPTVIDATAGTGRDAFVLANLGCRVTLIERSPVIAALLEDALERAAVDSDVAPLIERMTLVNLDACDYLETLPEARRPDVIYMDPMYPHRKKSAFVKKEMRIFRMLVGGDDDSPRLLEYALGTARRRVVVKRPLNAEPISGHAPTMVIKSPNTRYDIYIK